MKEIDFLTYGQAYLGSAMINILTKAEEIEKEYGIDARLEFESGIALAVPQYSKMVYSKSKKIDTDKAIIPVRVEEPRTEVSEDEEYEIGSR